MASPDIEDVIESTRQIFLSQFPAALQAVDASKSNPLQPKIPQDAQQYIFGDILQAPMLPCLIFSGHNTAEQVDDDRGWRKQTYSLEIEAYATADTVANLSRIVRRYGAAIDNTLRQNPDLGGIAKNVTNIAQQYWDTVSAKEGLFQVCRVSFDVRVITN